MSDITQVERDIAGPMVAPESNMADERPLAKRRDWPLRILIALATLAFVAALVVGALLIMDQFIGQPVTEPEPEHGFTVIPGQTQESSVEQNANPQDAVVSFLSSTEYWPQGLNTGTVLLVFLVVLGLMFLLLARRRALTNRATWWSAGCPACQEGSLVRVHRSAKDRVLAVSGVPVGRYLCLDCQWRGRRIRREEEDLLQQGERPDKFDDTFDISLKSAGLTRMVILGPEKIVPSGEDGKIHNLESGNHNTVIDSVAAGTLSPTLIEEDAAPSEDQEISESKATATIVGALAVNLLEEPRTNAVSLALLEPGTTVTLLENVAQVSGKDGLKWQQVQFNDRKGWILTILLKRIESS